MVYLPAAILGRLANETSCVLRKALAISTEEPTTTGNDPKRRCMMGPYFLDSSWMDRWGSEPMRFRFPMMGHGFGPGGKFALRRRRWRERRRRAKVASHAAAYEAQEGDSIGSNWLGFGVDRVGGAKQLMDVKVAIGVFIVQGSNTDVKSLWVSLFF